jgi:hypothetical protein
VFGNPTKELYVLVVEVTIKVGVSSTSLPLSKQPQRSLKLSTKKSRVIQTSQGSSIRGKLLGNAYPARSKAPRVIDANPTGLTKKSSPQACQSDSLTQSTLILFKTLGESNIGANRRGEGHLECLGDVLDESW